MKPQMWLMFSQVSPPSVERCGIFCSQGKTKSVALSPRQGEDDATYQGRQTDIGDHGLHGLLAELRSEETPF